MDSVKKFNAAFGLSRAGASYVIIRLDREKQKQRREKIGRIIMPPTAVHMNHNLQQGEILLIGDVIKELLPEIEEGDRLIFHHSVEGYWVPAREKSITIVTNDWRVYDNEYIDPHIYYAVRKDFIYGHIKPDGTIIVHPEMVLAIASPEEENNRNLKKVGALYIFNNYKEERQEVEKRLAELKREAETHTDRAEIIMAEMERITKDLNKKRAGTFMPVFIGSRVLQYFNGRLDTTYVLWYEFLGSKGTVPQVTTIDIDGYIFYVLRSDYILLAKKQKKFAEQDILLLDTVLKDYEMEKRKEMVSKVREQTRIAPGLIKE